MIKINKLSSIFNEAPSFWNTYDIKLEDTTGALLLKSIKEGKSLFTYQTKIQAVAIKRNGFFYGELDAS